MSEILEQISTAIIEGDLDAIQGLTEDALDEGIGAEGILNQGSCPAWTTSASSSRPAACSCPRCCARPGRCSCRWTA